MSATFKLIPALFAWAALSGCTQETPPSNPPVSPVSPAGTTAGEKGTGESVTPPPAATGQPQDPAAAKVHGTLLETLLANRSDDTTIYIADNERKPESESMGKIIKQLEAREIPFKRPKWPNYNYYLNRMIPITRTEGRMWLVFDHRLAKLTKVLTDDFIAHHTVKFRQEFDNGTLVLVTNEFSDDAPARYALNAVAGRGTVTTNIVFTPDGELMFVTGKGGALRWFSRTSDHKGPLHRFPTSRGKRPGVFSGGESGMVGMALHPEFSTNRKIYLHYNWRREDKSRSAILSEWTVDFDEMPRRLSLRDERQLLEIKQTHDNHNAGALVFGKDGYLYIAVGDGEEGKWTIGRSPAESLRGKVLRIDVNGKSAGKEYAIPADNPFVGDSKFPPETWAWGFRNPWRLALLPDGRLIASEIGEDVNEELTFVVKGKHHGWPYYEGLHVRNKWTLDAPLQPPLLPYGRKHGMSVIAGNVYEGSALPELVGKFVFCDYLSGRIWAFNPPATDATLDISDAEELCRVPLLLPTITKGPDGELYFGAHTGEVLQLGRNTAKGPQTAQLEPADPSMARTMLGIEFQGPAAPSTTPAQALLGRQLFGDTRLSADSTRSCATCHDLSQYGQDGRAIAAGGKRNTPPLFHAAQQFAQFRDFRANTVEDAVTESFVAHLGHSSIADAITHLRKFTPLVNEFEKAFPDQSEPLNQRNLELAVGAFVRSLTTESRWERFLDGDDAALTRPERIGLQQFLDSGCTTCHMYRGLGGGMPQKLGLLKQWQGPDKGRGAIDDTPGQEHFFKVPAMFNVAETGPWYHDGSMKTLRAAVQNMATIQLGRDLSDEQADRIVTFLKSLTGEVPANLR